MRIVMLKVTHCNLWGRHEKKEANGFEGDMHCE